jgi:hypothetical protein
MHVQLRRAGAVALLAAGGVLAPSACVVNESSLFIRGCLSVPRDSCTVQASTNATTVPYGTIDGRYSVREQYECIALFENQLVHRGDSTQLRTETSRVTVYQAEVQVLTTDPNNPQALAQFTVPVDGFADPGSGTEPGIGLTDIILISPAALKTLSAKAGVSGKVQVVASAILHGRTLGGQELTSNEFRFPIDIYGGKECSVPSDGICFNSTAKPAADCLLGQDSAVDCRSVGVCNLVCDATGDFTTATCPDGAPSGYVPCCP